MGTSCPDHFLRTKIKPLVLNIPKDIDLSDKKLVSKKIEPLFEKYRKDYREYYENCKKGNSPEIRDSNPVVILYPGVGMFTFAKNKQTSRVASEFYINAINVMRGAETISSYTSLSRQEAFNIEYWLLEEAKLKRQPAEKPLSGKVSLVTGAGGGIGKAISEKLIKEGANVIFVDISDDNFKDLKNKYNSDQALFCKCDVTKSDNIENTINKSILKFGGLDIIINSAGLAISKSIQNTTEKDWDKLQRILVKGQFLFSKLASKLFKIQNLGGDIVNIVSKNGISSGPNNVGYGTAKAAQLHMSRLMATELAEFNIKVNSLNPDGVIIGSKIWKGSWAAERAKSHGIKVSQLPEFYAKRNLLNQIIKPEDIANGVFALLTSLNKSTGNIINIDGGIPQAFVR
jgi:NAD(P)-dependent dehydrogenase (short-subunit alcohol dehydrogenase family)